MIAINYLCHDTSMVQRYVAAGVSCWHVKNAKQNKLMVRGFIDPPLRHSKSPMISVHTLLVGFRAMFSCHKSLSHFLLCCETSNYCMYCCEPRAIIARKDKGVAHEQSTTISIRIPSLLGYLATCNPRSTSIYHGCRRYQ